MRFRTDLAGLRPGDEVELREQYVGATGQAIIFSRAIGKISSFSPKQTVIRTTDGDRFFVSSGKGFGAIAAGAEQPELVLLPLTAHSRAVILERSRVLDARQLKGQWNTLIARANILDLPDVLAKLREMIPEPEAQDDDDS